MFSATPKNLQLFGQSNSVPLGVPLDVWTTSRKQVVLPNITTSSWFYHQASLPLVSYPLFPKLEVIFKPLCLSAIRVDRESSQKAPWMAACKSPSPDKRCALQQIILCKCPLLQKPSFTILDSQTKWRGFGWRTGTHNFFLLLLLNSAHV